MNNINILLISRDKDFSNLLEKELKSSKEVRLNFFSCSEENYNSFLFNAISHGVEIVIIDMNSVDMEKDIWRIFIEEYKNYSCGKVIIIFPEDKNKLFGYEIGADDCFNYPINIVELDCKIRVLLSLSRKDEVHKLKCKILDLVSHEIRTPLNSVLGFTTIFNDEDVLFSIEERREIKGFIKEGTQRITDLLNAFCLYNSFTPDTTSLREGDIMRNLEAVTKKYCLDNFHFYEELDNNKFSVIRADWDHINIALEYFTKGIKNIVEKQESILVDFQSFETESKVIFSIPWKNHHYEKEIDFFSPFNIYTEIKNHTRGYGIELALAKKILITQGWNVVVEKQNNTINFIVNIPNNISDFIKVNV